MKSSEFTVAIIGWHEGLAGVIDSWLPEVGIHVKCFISVNHEHLNVDSSAHLRFGNKKYTYPTKDYFKKRPLIEDSIWYTHSIKYPVDGFIIALDNNEDRVAHINEALTRGVNLISAIHPSVRILEEVSIGQNCILHAGSTVGYKAILGHGVILNTGSQLDHHVVVEDGVTIDPGCVVAGNVLIKKFATLHTSTTVINKIIIGTKSITGAGSVVIRDVQDNTTVIGVPAKPLEPHKI